MRKDFELYPLTIPQKSIWYTEKMYPDTSINIIAGTLRIKENVNPEILEKAINIFIEKNDSMRIRLVETDGEPRQYISDYEYKRIDFIDFSGRDISDLYKWDEQQTKTPLRLFDSDLYYFAIIKVSDNDVGFYVKCHHLISDAWSISLLGNQIMTYYSLLKRGAPVPEGNNPSYIDYIASEQDYMQSERFKKDGEYWNKEFETFPGKTLLKESSTEVISIKSRRKTMLTPKKLAAKIDQFCAQNRTSAFSLFIAALAMYINRISGKEDIILGTTTLNRANAKEKATVGMFANTCPIRVGISDGMNLNSLIKNITENGFKLLRHQKYPYEYLLKEVRNKHKIYGSVFDIVLNYQNSRFTKEDFEEQYLTRWHFNGYQADSLRININDREGEGRLILDYDYRTDVFLAKEIEFIHQNIINILWHALDDPTKKISRLEMLSEKEKHRILHDFNRTRIIYPRGNGKEDRGKKIPERAKSYILDKNLNLMPIGIAGDLYLSGASLTKAWLKSLGLTEEAAVPSPFIQGDVLYKTGIRARWFPDGDIMFMGGSGGRDAGSSAGNENNKEAGPVKGSIKVNIMSTFTVEPVSDYIKFWGNKFGYDINVNFADYNQVFQELLNPESMMAENIDGINAALIRFEDFIRHEKGTEQAKLALLEKAFGDLKEALGKFENNAPMIIAVFPASDRSGLSPALQQRIAGMNREFTAITSKQKNLFMLDFSDLHVLYNISEVYDPLRDKEAHMPFSDEYYAAMGTELARKILAIKRQEFKIIVLDCDNTLWKGICGEMGALGVQVTEPYRKLQQFMLRKYNEGILLAVLSKNNLHDVHEVFEKNPGMVLKKDHIIDWKVSWEEKSARIREIAQELGIGLDSFIFIDDDSLECSKMVESCPEVLTLQLPSDENLIPSFLNHTWAFDKVRVTSEDVLRNRMYRQEKKRKELKSGGISLESFLKSLELKVSMRFAGEEDIARAAQLTQRTNQFNLSTIRRNEEEIALLMKDDTVKCFVVEVSDKFGDYGIIGLVILKDNGGSLFMDTFLMSCRIFGRNVEDMMLAGIAKYADELGRRTIETIYVQTEKNKPAHDFIKRTKWELVEKSGARERYRINAADLPRSVGHIEFYYMKPYEKPEEYPEMESSDSYGECAAAAGYPVTARRDDIAGGLGNGGVGYDYIEFNTGIMKKNVRHRAYIEPLDYPSGRKLLQIFSYKHVGPGSTVFENEKQEKLASIWESLLKTHNIGLDDDFFELGGDSLHAVILLSRISKEFGIELTLRDVFGCNTIRKLAAKLDDSQMCEYGRIKPVKPRQYYELSSAQKRMYILSKIETDQTAYNECHKIRIQGKLDRTRLEEAFREFIRRHEIMRTGFEMSDEGPVQKVYDSVDFSVPYVKASEKNLDKLADEFIKPFDLSKPPLMRVSLIETGKEKHTLLIDVHHIVIDGASFGILIREIQALYEGRELDPPALQYKDFAYWQNELFKSPQLIRQEQYWMSQYDGEIPVLNLPTDHMRPAVQSFNGKKLFFSIGAEEVERIRKICSGSGTTMFMLLFAAFNVLLNRYSGQEDIVVGIPVSGRRHPDTRDIVGMFVNTLPIRTRPKGGAPFMSYLEEVRESILLGLENQDYPYESLLEKLSVPRELNRNPLFDVLFSLRNTDMPELDIRGLSMELGAIDNHKTKFDISLLASENEGNLEFCLEYCSDLFSDDYISRFREHFLNILREVAENPRKRISDIEIMGEEEKRKIIYEFNDTGADYPRDKTVHRLFEEQAERTPDSVAVVFGDKELTYRELNAKANQLARVLRDKGVGPDTIVAIMVERSLEMIIGILAILKAGGAYLPIDPDYPEERIGYMLEDSGAKVLLHANSFAKNIEHLKYPGIKIEIDHEKLCGDSDNLCNVNRPNDLAYVIYTSGSTGNPKGVMIEHHSVVNRIVWMQKAYPIDRNSIILQKTPYTFDVSVWELFWWSFYGAKLCFLKPRLEKDPEEIIKAIEKHGVTTMHFVPSMLNVFLKYLELHDCADRISTLKQVFSSGEALTTQHVNMFNDLIYSRNKTVLINLYGPTEATVDVSHFNCSTGEKLEIIPIGKPIDNIRLYILDGRNNLQPIGIPGELYIGGVGLARGYINNEKLTGERFIENPHIKGELIYKTGDLAKWNSNGEVEYLGRLDFQVKVRGFRIELGEIEKSILKYKNIKEAVVILDGSSGESHLCACIVSDEDMDINDLRLFISRYLPGYMVPSRYVRIPEIPLLPNGKVNRKKLAEIAKTQLVQHKEQVKPVGEIQEILSDVFKRILNIDVVNADDNFFEIGGDSISSIRLSLELYKLFGIDLNYIDIFNNPTIITLGRLVSSRLINWYRDDIDIGHTFMLLNNRGDRNIFAFPPITGFGLAFNNMSKYLNHHKLYAFNYVTDNDKIDMYVKNIKEVQPQGPYILLGFSAGAYIALEISKLLPDESILILIDGFYGDISKNEIEKNVDFFVRYSKDYINITGDNKFIDDLLMSRIRDYMYYIADMNIYGGKTNSDIYYLQSDEMPDSQIEKISKITAKSFYRYRVGGNHFDLLKEKNSKSLSGLIESILIKKYGNEAINAGKEGFVPAGGLK
ncbi:MAG: amino acid adenylation domain-containing protein [Bacillota bacterium]